MEMPSHTTRRGGLYLAVVSLASRSMWSIDVQRANKPFDAWQTAPLSLKNTRLGQPGDISWHIICCTV